MRSGAAAAFAFLLASCATPQAAAPPPQITLTIDDLPVHGPIPEGETPMSVARGVISALSNARVPAHGFVNARWTADQPDTLEVLKAWRAAGLPLANHGWAHRHLNEMSIAKFEQELARDEPVLRQLAGETDWRWFRYPFLDEGKDAAQRAAARQVLARRGYRIAAVTMDFSDWAWTAPFARCVANKDQPSIAHLEEMYLAAAREAIGHYRALSHQLYGRDIPYVVLLHDSAFEARMLPRLIELYRSAGFRFVDLPEAERDAAYADQVHPRLPAEPQGLEQKAVARGIPLPPRHDFQPELAGLCPAVPSP
jgi:peptidoglycan/xylan/chitin deacetylase (PgdA/CDA1 family)